MSFLSQNIKRKQVYPHKSEGTAYSSDFTAVNTGGFNGVDTSGGNIIVTMPKVSDFWDNKSVVAWFFKKMSDDNKVLFALEDSNDSFMPDIQSLSLSKKNAGLEIILNANGKYTFSKWDGIVSSTSSPVEVSTLTPVLSEGNLEMKGSIDDLGINSSVEAYFRYKEVGGETWIETVKQTITEIGQFADGAEVNSELSFEVQALVEVNSIVYYGAVLRTTVNYYPDIDEARNDGLVWGSRMQEGAEDYSSDVFGAYDIELGGATWGSDTINSQTIYKILFGDSASGQSNFQPTVNEVSYTMLLQVQADTTSGDHTILNFGRNILSLAIDGTGLQLEVGRNISTANSQTPFSAIKNIWLTVDIEGNKTKVEVSTDSVVTELTSQNRIPSDAAAYTRLARGSSGDANHQDNEYLDNGAFRSIWIWEGIKPDQFKMDLSSLLDTDGGQVV